MRNAVIVCPRRTAVGRFLGVLRPLPAEALAAEAIRAVVAASGIDPERIEEVIFAQSYANSEAPCIGRWAALAADLPLSVAGSQIDRRCGGGLSAIATAAMMVQTGAADVVLAGGVESMSNIEYYSTDMRHGARAGSVRLHDRLDRGRERSQPEARFGYVSGLIETAENLARDYDISRAACDAYALRSQQRAADAWEAGRFDAELISLDVPQGKGPALRVARDEGVRPDTTLEGLARLKPMMADGVCTPGNSAQQNDAAAACLVVAEDHAAALGLTPIARLVGWTAVGCDPTRMGIGPVPAIERLLARTGLALDAMDLIEINEAFAAQVLAVVKALGGVDEDRLNVNGSGLSLGHPIGATGVRIMTSLLHELDRRGGRYGLESMCVGGGQGMAAIFERL
nr:acetyl-CoA C-acetyltransferase [uncultured Brevundimonas sp.]